MAAIHTVQDSPANLSTKLVSEFLILTSTRSGEVRLVTQVEMDVEDKVWTVPAERMIAKRTHRVPLSSQAVAVLDETREHRDRSVLVFPSPTGRVLSDSTLSKLLRELGIGAVPHGFRSSFRDWVAYVGPSTAA